MVGAVPLAAPQPAGNAVTQALNIASAQLQITVAQDILTDDERNLQLVRLKLEAGKASRLDVLTADSQLAADRTQLLPLRQQLSVARRALAMLASRFPGQHSPPDFELTDFTLPGKLPVTVPSALIH